MVGAKKQAKRMRGGGAAKQVSPRKLMAMGLIK